MSNLPSIRRAYVDTTQGQIHFRHVVPNNSKGPLVFLHKSASSSASYDSLMKAYSSKGYACYAPDMPGFGASFDPTETQVGEIRAQGTSWYADVFMQAFEGMGLDISGVSGKIPIIGHHSGAVLAVELAATRKEFVASICLVGPAVMTEEERVEMKSHYFDTFNKPMPDGSHLIKTWEYLRDMGVGDDMDVWQREAVDHIRAWRGRNLIYGAVWAQDAEDLYKSIECPIMLMCARDDVLWKFFEYVKDLRPEAIAVEVGGGNFELDRDVEGIEKAWTAFLGI